MMSPRLRTDLLAVYLAYAFRYLYPLVLLPFYGRTLGAEGYGTVMAGLSLSNTLWMLVTWGLPSLGGRDTALAGDDRPTRARILAGQLSGRLLLALPVALTGAVALSASPVLSGLPGAALAVLLLGCSAGFNLGWYYTATQRARTSVHIEVFGFALSLALLLGCVRGPEDASLVLWLLLLSCLGQLGIAYWLVRAEFAGARPTLAAGADAVRQSTTLFIYSGTSVLLITSSTYLLSLLAPAGEVGAFGVAERLISAGLSLMGPASQILFPRITRLVADDPDAANRATRRILAVFAGGALLALLVTLAAAPLVIGLLVGARFEGAVPVLRLLAFVLPVAAATQVLGNYFLIPRQQDGTLARAAIVSALVNLGCAVPLASHWGALGMAAARLAGEIVLLGLVLAGIRRAGLLGQLLGRRDATGDADTARQAR
ncbi:lipopolysaccharide biosynthesis protein [Derxia gummosa]|uniref:Lipopolysaccharide biosynthesis protein n=1 Tax=Derxia gummosa DSM 723 TaxID=1121388 RepID=A0A8B6X9N7_9BURK|nr:oligosaccharide flippase family protein [Derxia gummosa]